MEEHLNTFLIVFRKKKHLPNSNSKKKSSTDSTVLFSLGMCDDIVS
jgi:hypothetical protein